MNPIMKQLETLRTERDQARDAAIQLAAAEDFNPEDRTFQDLETRATQLDTQIERLTGLLEAQKGADALDGKLSKAERSREERLEVRDRPRSWGEQFVDSDQYRDYNFRGTSAKVDIEMRALPHSVASMDAALPSNPVIDTTPTPTPNIILPLVNQVTVSGNSVDYITWAKTGSAAVVPEGTLKPSVEWAPTVISRSLATIAGHTSVTRQLAEDSAAVRSYITNELQADVRRELEEQAVAAIAAATLPTATGPSGKGVLGAIRAGMAAVQAEGFAPNGFLVNSDDLIDLDLEVMATAGTAPNQTNSFWGLRPVVAPAGLVAAGSVIVGDFRKGVDHYQRGSVSLYATDSHGENFRYNILDFIAETRALTAVVRPDALATATAGV